MGEGGTRQALSLYNTNGLSARRQAQRLTVTYGPPLPRRREKGPGVRALSYGFSQAASIRRLV